MQRLISPFSEMVQRIDANTEDVVDNVQGAQRELMKYWSRVSGNRWLVAKMFGVLMVSFFRPYLSLMLIIHRSSSCYGSSSQGEARWHSYIFMVYLHLVAQPRHLAQLIHTWTLIVQGQCSPNVNRQQLFSTKISAEPILSIPNAPRIGVITWTSFHSERE